MKYQSQGTVSPHGVSPAPKGVLGFKVLPGYFYLELSHARARRAPPGVFLPPSPWAWIDPGVFSLIGAGAFMGGVTRLSVALAVIMMEV